MGIAVNTQAEGKVPAKRINAHSEGSKHSKGRASFLKCVKENDQKEKEAKEKGTWAPLPCQPVLPRDTPCENPGKEPEQREPVPYGFMT